jgi:hypothetical protein
MPKGITVTEELFLAFRNQDGELLAVEQENGEITRHITEKSSSGKSARALGADLPPAQLKVTSTNV